MHGNEIYFVFSTVKYDKGILKHNKVNFLKIKCENDEGNPIHDIVLFITHGAHLKFSTERSNTKCLNFLEFRSNCHVQPSTRFSRTNDPVRASLFKVCAQQTLFNKIP